MDIIYWSVRPSSKRRVDKVKGGGLGDRYFSQLQVIRVHDNLM